MASVKPYTIDDLKNQETLDQFKTLVNDEIMFNQLSGVNETRLVLEDLLSKAPDFERDNPFFYGEYQKLLVRIKWAVFDYLSDKDALDLVENNLTAVLADPDIDVWHKIREKLISHFIIEERDKFRKEIIRILNTCKLKLGPTKLTRAGEQIDGTVANWLRDYNFYVGSEGVREKLKINEYLLKGEHTKKMTPEEKKAFQQIIKIYEKLRPASDTVDGVMERLTFFDLKQPAILEDGEVVTVNLPELEAKRQKFAAALRKARGLPEPVPTTPVKAPKDIIKRYSGSKEEQTKVATFQKELAPRLRDKNLASVLMEIIKQEKDRNEKLLAFLILLVINKKLINLYGQSSSLKDDFVNYLAKKAPNLSAVFKSTPKSPEVYSHFLKFLLIEQLKLSETESARWAMQLSALAKKAGAGDYANLAYFDFTNNNFAWR